MILCKRNAAGTSSRITSIACSSLLYITYLNVNFLQQCILLHFVPYGASRSILLKILDFWGRLWGIWIFIDFNGLEDKLHYCNKSCAILMIVGFHLLCSLHVSFWPVMPNLNPFFHHLDAVFFLRLREHVYYLWFSVVSLSVKLSEKRID
jgi:hypothetical protein